MNPKPSQLRPFILFATSLAMLVCVTSCGKQQGATTDTTPPPATGGNAPNADTAWTDAGITATVIAANTLDIENAQMAQTVSKTPAVMTFASQMSSDHTLLNAKVSDLAGKLTMVPRDNDMSRDLTTRASGKRDSLKSLTGADFDKAYIDAEIVIHEGAIDLVGGTLIPRAQNAELKTLLESTLPIFQGHLAHAKAVRASLH